MAAGQAQQTAKSRKSTPCASAGAGVGAGAGKRSSASVGVCHSVPTRARASERMDPLDWQARNGADIVPAQTGVRAGETGFRRLRPIDALLRRKGITYEMWLAADRLAADYEIGVLGARDTDGGEMPAGIRGAGGVDGYAVRQLDAAGAYRLAVRAMGLIASAAVLPVVIEGWTITDLAGRRTGTLAVRLAAVLDDLRRGLSLLADHYGV